MGSALEFSPVELLTRLRVLAIVVSLFAVSIRHDLFAICQEVSKLDLGNVQQPLMYHVS